MKGMNLTEQDMNKATDLESRYSFYRKLNDPSMGEVTLLKSNTSDEVICFKEQIKNSKEQFAQSILEARERLKTNHKNIIEMKDYSTRQKNDFCSTFYAIRTFYEYQMNNLQKEIKHRKDKGQDFSMIELTHLLYNITEAGAFLQDRGRSHGDIRPSSIAVLEEGKTYKLADRPDTSVTPMQAQLNYIFSGKEIYVTPQLYSALKKNNLKVNHNEYKSDVFSFGLCLLEAGLKRGISNIYTDNSFNVQELERLLEEFGKKYEDNPLLVTTLRKMLSIEEAERPDFKTILNAIPSYNEIIDFFEGEDQYYNEGEDFTASQYPTQDQVGMMHHGGAAPQMMGQYPPQQTGGYQGVQGGHHAQAHTNLGGASNQYGQLPVNGIHPNTAGQYDAHSGYGTSQYGHHGQPAPQFQQPAPQSHQQNYGQHHGYQQQVQAPQGYYQPPTSPQPQPQPQHSPYGQQGYGQPTGISPQYPSQYAQPQAQMSGYSPANNQSIRQAPGQQPFYPQSPQVVSSPMVTSQPQYSPQVSSHALPQGGAEIIGEGEIKVINGLRYREVKEARNEVNAQGQTVKKVMVRLQPLDDHVKKGPVTGATSPYLAPSPTGHVTTGFGTTVSGGVSPAQPQYYRQ